MQKPRPNNLKDLLRLTFPPKGVGRKKASTTTNKSPVDKGDEL